MPPEPPADLPAPVPPHGDAPVSAQVLVNELRRVLGVDSVEIDTDASGGIARARMVLLPGADESQVASAIDEVLRRRYGMSVDPSQVEVIEESVPESAGRSAYLPLPGGMDDGEPAGLTGRPVLRRVFVGADGNTVRVEVWLDHMGRTFAGTAEGPTEVLPRTVATATLDAVRQVLGPGVVLRVDLADVEVGAGASGGNVVVVQVVLAAPDGAERLTGASSVRDDVDQAVARATLDALNRRLQPLFGPDDGLDQDAGAQGALRPDPR